MKFIKIVIGVVAALWALALILEIVSGVSNTQGEFAFSRNMGSVVGILLASAISAALFKSAARD